MTIKQWLIGVLLVIASMLSPWANATLIIPVYATQGLHRELGYVQADDTIYGVLFTPFLRGLPSGIHGFHVHQCSSCAYDGEIAGDHLGLVGVHLHNGPYKGNSHLGDLPVLIVNKKGRAELPVLAPRLKLRDIVGKTLMIDAGGDNYSDTPEVNGGGKFRIACGEVPLY